MKPVQHQPDLIVEQKSCPFKCSYLIYKTNIQEKGEQYPNGQFLLPNKSRWISLFNALK